MNAYIQQNQPPGVPPLELTGERTLPDVPAENYWFRRHLAVYEWIAGRVAGKRVIDMACGEGYGSEWLARRALEVVGVDANPDAHEHARLRYVRPNLSFERGLVETFGEPGSFDAVVFLQTIEHVHDPIAVLEHLRSLLAPDGVAYISTPNVLKRWPRPGPRRSGNPWHMKEYQADEFHDLCARGRVRFRRARRTVFTPASCESASRRCGLAGTRSTPGWGSRSASTTGSRRRSRSRTSRSAPIHSIERSIFSPCAGCNRGASVKDPRSSAIDQRGLRTSTIQPRARGESPRWSWRPALCSLFKRTEWALRPPGRSWRPTPVFIEILAI